ncbi:methyltransferase [Streptomyces sp. BRB081]|uniref:methyltransferase n=1 Tax=Streptomyces sp. BRB081 TaxID=2769544 RepID=UPI0018ACA758|nr:methyltransferase [Streptomyces sp. BRB081]MBL3808344.1 methyltransferase [Streptomyces sp. BRB081]
MNELGLVMGQEAYAQALTQQDRELEFTLLDREWTQLPGVLGGEYNYATGLFASALPRGGVDSMLEMGCGCGVASVTAALAGVPKVTALDINPAAVRTTELNARRHGVADRVTARTSDLFSALAPDETFDLVFWNSPFIETPPDRQNDSDLAYHFFDPDYTMHRRFLAEVGGRLTARGRLFLGFSFAMGSPDSLRKVSAEAGFDLRVHRQESFTVPTAELGTSPVYAAHADEEDRVTIDFTLLELSR